MLVGVLTSACAGGDSGGGGSDGQTVRLALSAFQDVNSVYVGLEKGYFDDAGVKLDITQSDWPSANELLVGGHVDLANACESDVMLHNAQKNDTTLAFPLFYFAGGGLVFSPEKHHWKGFEDFLKENGGDRTAALRSTLEQAKGAKIGVSKVSGDYPTLLGLLETAGLDVKDYDVLDIVQEELPPTLFSGSIDIMIGGIPQRLIAIDKGYDTLLDQSAVPSTIAHCGFAAHRKWVDDNPQLAAKVEGAILKSLAYIEKHPDDAFPIIADHLKSAGTEISVDQLKNVWNKMEFFPDSPDWYDKNVVSPDGKFYWRARFDSVHEQLQAAGSLKSELSVPMTDLNYGLKTVPASAKGNN
jgi:ABC-type nitrate/sulfonate/bicarbonate transport system substrate-binding protein